jgi:hypothetical protein
MHGGAPIGDVSASVIPTGRKALFPLALVTTLFFLWGFVYGLLDVLNKHFQEVLGLTKLESTGLQVAHFGAYIAFPAHIGDHLSKDLDTRFHFSLALPFMLLVLYFFGHVHSSKLLGDLLLQHLSLLATCQILKLQQTLMLPFWEVHKLPHLD